MTRIFVVFYIISFFVLVAYSSESVENMFKQHEVRIGWGDMLFETVAFHYRKSNTWLISYLTPTITHTLPASSFLYRSFICGLSL